jgi:RNA polymerase sigma-70 factor, ECF subfamily
VASIFYLVEHVKLPSVPVESPSDPRSDQDLVAAANAGDPGAFDVLYHRHKAWVLSLATRCTGDADQALDVLQETFIYLLSKFPGFKLTSRLTTFLYPAVKNISIAVRRKSARFGGGQQPFDTLPGPVAAGQNELTEVVSSLPATQREVVLMRFVDGLSLEEIGVALGIPLGTVKSRLHNALAALRTDPRVQRFFEP